ncbi:MAG: hypothetical protein RI958_731 [Actinomycetota bacterium]
MTRSWPQRLLLLVNIVVIAACFIGAGGIVVARYYGNSLSKVDLVAPATSTPLGSASTTPATPGETASVTEPTSTATPETFPPADPEAKNFLITGADNNACIDPDSPYASAFGDRSTGGERSDTIMIMRVDPATKQAAVLSFPRDLWVQIAGRGKQRINTAYVKDEPQRLIDTIFQNFGVSVDHFIQVDFCAFKTIVDGLGGVAVPFEYPARDVNTGLDVATTGCFTFDGDHALAYVRSRKYQYLDTDGRWKGDPAGDLGRVSRQQDFLRRVISQAIDRGVTDPTVARSLIKAAQDYVVVDRALTINRMLQFVGVLRGFEPGGIAAYQIEAENAVVSNNAVLIPRIKGENMQTVLKIFTGELPLAGAPEQVFDTTTTAAPSTTTGPTVPGPTTTTRGTASTTTSTTTTAPPAPLAEENAKGIVPPKDISC